MSAPTDEIARLLERRYAVTVTCRGEGAAACYIAAVPDLPGCTAEGSTPDDAVSLLRHAKRGWILLRVAAGAAIPEPRTPVGPSGPWV